MDELENIESVIRLLRAHKCANENLNSETLIDQLEMDSIHIASFILDLEEEFSILVSDEAFSNWIKVGDIAEHIDSYLEEYGSGDLSEM